VNKSYRLAEHAIAQLSATARDWPIAVSGDDYEESRDRTRISDAEPHGALTLTF
jgi:hypothetical protein